MFLINKLNKLLLGVVFSLPIFVSTHAQDENCATFTHKHNKAIIMGVDKYYKGYIPAIKEQVALVVPTIKEVAFNKKNKALLSDIYYQLYKRKAPAVFTEYDLFRGIHAFLNKNSGSLLKTRAGKNLLPPAFADLRLLVQGLSDNLADEMGIERLEVLFIFDTKLDEAAWYTSSKHNITINIGHPAINWRNLVSNIIWHEMYHAWQYNCYINEDQTSCNKDSTFYQISNRDFSYNNNSLDGFEKLFRDNYTCYQPSDMSYKKYSIQPIEYTSRVFGEEILKRLR